MDFLEDSNLFQQILDHCLLFSVYPAGKAQKNESHGVHQAITAGSGVRHHHNSQNISSQNSLNPRRFRTNRVFLHYGDHRYQVNMISLDVELDHFTLLLNRLPSNGMLNFLFNLSLKHSVSVFWTPYQMVFAKPYRL